MRCFRFRPVLLAGFMMAALAPAPFAVVARAEVTDQMDDVSAGTKHGRLRKLQIINRAYQVSFGRSMRPSEAKKLSNASKLQIIQQIMGSDELARIYAQRLAAYISNKSDPSGSLEVRVSASVKNLAKPTDKLEDVMRKLSARRHKGSPCGDGKDATCFAQWLVGRVAPSLGQSWVTQREGELVSWSYARLLEQITLSSL